MDRDTFDARKLIGKTIKDIYDFDGTYLNLSLVIFDDNSRQKVLFHRLDDTDRSEFYELFLTLWDKATTEPGYVKKPWGKLNDLLVDIGMGPKRK